MAIETERSNTMQTIESSRLPGTFLALQQQLERIRQEQLAKNRSTLQTLAAEQRQNLEFLTLAITRNIFEEVIQGWELSIAEGNESEITETITLLWGSMADTCRVPRAY